MKLLKKYNDALGSNKSYKKPSKFNATTFIVVHYAGEVEYDVNSFLDKNRDTVNDVISKTLSSSKSVLLQLLY